MTDKMKENKDAQSGEPVQLDKDQQQGGQPKRPQQQPGQQQPGQQQGGQEHRPQQQPGQQQQGGQQHEGGQKR